MDKVCSSCKKNISNMRGSVEFPCPKCGKAMIIRCLDCRKKGVPYVCPECGFEGPN